MHITVRYFASLREALGRAEDELDAEATLTVGEAWRRLHGNELPPRLLAAVNQEYVGPDHPLHEGDEVAFFPPVTGG